jgi:aminoglycoside phosphotransferase (APT) family kinase protein
VLISNRRDSADAIRELYAMVSPGFLKRYEQRLTNDEKQMVQLVGDNLDAYISSYPGEQTLIHIDYRLDNMMFGGPYPLAVVDWQSPAFDCALGDVSYFMGTSIIEDERGELEGELVRQYFDTLSVYNVSMTWEECWHYYRHYAPAGMIMAVIASMLVGETERGNDMFMAMAKRSAYMSRELDSIGAIRV